MLLPGVPAELLQTLVAAAEGRRLALVGGAVRDLLLHRVHQEPWSGLPDLDLVVEAAPGERRSFEPGGSSQAPASALANRLLQSLGPEAVPVVREHGDFGTVEVELLLPGSVDPWLLDIASARQETYPVPAENPLVRLGGLEDDLARRDFTINAMALLLDRDGCGVQLLDPYGGEADLASRTLRLLHPGSIRDDPTRLIRGARYAARLGFAMATDSLRSVHDTLASWPWSAGEGSAAAPPALGTRLRRELELLLEREPWPLALAALQQWGGLALLDGGLQKDRGWTRRLRRARRLGLPLIVALIAASDDPTALAERLQLPQWQCRLLLQFLQLKQRLDGIDPDWPPSQWCRFLEAPGLSVDAVALAVAACPLETRAIDGRLLQRRLLSWLFRWRYVKAPVGASDLIAAGVAPGPALGQRLAQERSAWLDRDWGRSEVRS